MIDDLESKEIKVFSIISYISFIILIISGILSYINLHNLSTLKFFWNIISFSLNVIPIQIEIEILYILFSILLLLSIASFVIIILNRHYGLKQELFGKYSKFHFIPILCAASLYIIGECYYQDNTYNDAPYILSLIFSLLGLGSLAFIYIKTKISKFYAKLVIKKGLYPCLIALFVYNLFFTITAYGTIKLDSSEFNKWSKPCCLTFAITIGVINLVLSFFLKDIIISGMNFLIYLGMTIYFFNIQEILRQNLNGNAEGIIAIIFIVLSIDMIVFLTLRYKNNIFEY